MLFDSLNRYYLAEEASELAACFATAPAAFEHALQFRNVKPALADDGLRRGWDLPRVGRHPGPEWISDLKLPAGATVRDLYGALVETGLFRAACGRISASYAW